MHIFTDPDNTLCNNRLISHDFANSLNSLAILTDSNMQFSKSNQSGKTNSIKNLSCLFLTKYPIKLFNNISEIPSMQ